MKALAVFLILCIPAFGQKMEVKVVRQFVDGHPYTRMVPGIGIGNANATANFNRMELPLTGQQVLYTCLRTR
jgi:hypothetical protein